ncbi:MAG: SUMF1/EgtB/PvdO family nonheme iron enzyme [Planctomycetaceae bacterium]|nr:SUMF1/EgtB/PvdO family nonheme iron enzyme [Planctomycetaceae bacterium]
MPDPPFDPYHKWLGIPAKDQPANHYRLLGLDLFEADAEVIESAAIRQMIHVRSFAIGKYGDVSQSILNEIAKAKLTLIQEESKKAYDKKLRDLASHSSSSPNPEVNSGKNIVAAPVECPSCGVGLALNESLYGKTVKCSKCNAVCEISGDGKQAITPSVATEKKILAQFDAISQPDLPSFTGGQNKSSAAAVRKSHKKAFPSKRFYVIAFPVAAILGVGLAIFFLLGVLKPDPVGIMASDTNPKRDGRTETTSMTTKVNEHEDAWMHKSLIAQYDLDNGNLRNVASGRAGSWRDGDRAKGRWVRSFTRIPTHKSMPDRFGKPKGAVSGVFGVHDQPYSLKTFTIAVWFRWIEDHPTDKYQVLIGKCSKIHLHNCNYMLSVANLGEDKNGGFLQATVSGGAGKETSLTSGPLQVTDKQWHHAVLVCDYKTAETSLFLDGKQVDKKKLIDGVDTSEGLAFAGYWRGHNWCYGIFTGDLDDLRIYTAPLTSTQIAKLYAYESTTPPTPIPSIAPLLSVQQAVMLQQAWSDHLKVPVESTNSIGMKFAVIPPGEFTMGSPGQVPGHEDNETPHRVTLSQPFQMGVHEVTQAQYQQVMGTNVSQFDGSENPVEKVSWSDATEFCRKLSALPEEKAAGHLYRLPTEAEWEHACRAGTDTVYSFGDSDAEFRDYAWFAGNSNGETHPIGLKKPNRWGLYDMYGNVSEFTVSDQTGSSAGSFGFLRGGNWQANSEDCRSASRRKQSEDDINSDGGFRVVRVPTPQTDANP